MIRIVSLIIACTSVVAAATPAKKKTSHSVQALAQYILKNGKQDTTIDVVEKDLGFPDSKPAKAMNLESKAKNTEITETISVRYDSDGKKTSANSIVWYRTTITTQDSKKTTDLWGFRSDLQGQLKSVVHGGGVGDDLDEKPAPIDEAARKAFAEIKESFLAASFNSLTIQ